MEEWPRPLLQNSLPLLISKEKIYVYWPNFQWRFWNPLLQALATLVKALLITVILDWTFHLEIELLIQDLFCFVCRGLLRILTHFGRFLFVKSEFHLKKNSQTDNWNSIINFRSLCIRGEGWKILPWFLTDLRLN